MSKGLETFKDKDVSNMLAIILEDVKQANELSKEFMQTPFFFDDANHKIEVTASSLDAFVSVISNTKKLGIAKHEYEDSLANKRTTKQ